MTNHIFEAFFDPNYLVHLAGREAPADEEPVPVYELGEGVPERIIKIDSGKGVRLDFRTDRKSVV